MYEQRIITSEFPRIEVTSCQGDLTVSVGDSSEVLIKVDNQEILTVEEKQDAVAMVIAGKGQVVLPPSAALVIVQVQGDLTIKSADGTIEVATVQGDVRVKSGTGNASLGTVLGDLKAESWTGNFKAGVLQGDAKIRQMTGDINLGTVNGDLRATEIDGPLVVSTIKGDAHLRQLNGPFAAENISADLIARDLLGGADVTLVNGDVSLKTVLAGPQAYYINAKGNISAKVFPGSNATFRLQADKGQVRAKGIDGETTGDGQWQGILKDGEAQALFSSTHSNVVLKVLTEDEKARAYADFAHEMPMPPMPSSVPADELAWRIQQRVAEKLSKIDFEAIALREAERARRQAERDVAKAQRAMEKAQRRAERAQRKAAYRQRKAQWRIEWDSASGGRKASKRGPAVSKEEQLAILNMLSEGKISAEEAETLLQALGE